MVHSQQVEDRGVEVIDVGLVDGGLVSELIRLSVADAPLDASPGEPGGCLLYTSPSPRD